MKNKNRNINLVLAIFGILLTAMVGIANAETYKVFVDDYYGFYRIINSNNGAVPYENRTLSVNLEDTVVWINDATPDQALTIVSKDGLFGDTYLRWNQQFNYTFVSSGIYEFYIKEYPRLLGMKIVVNSNPTSPEPKHLIISSDTSIVTVGIRQNVIFTVTDDPNYCPPGQVCALVYIDPSPISGAYVRLEGSATGSGYTENGKLMLNVNASIQGTITAIASKSGYINGKVTIDAKSPSIPAPNLIDVSVISKPTGANIFINDVYKGNAPKTIKLTEGTYNLRADLAGYKSKETDFKITSDMTRQDISIILEPIENSRFRVGPTVRIRPLNDVINKSSDGLVELYMDNPSLNDVVLKVDARISVPAGIHVYGQGFGEATAAGTVYGVFEVPPGKAMTVYIRFKADRTGDFTAQFSGTYYPGDNKDAYQPISLTHLFKVYEINQPGNISTPIITIPPTDIIPVTNKRAILQVTYNIEKSDNGAIVTIKINNIGDDVARFVSLSTTIPSELNPILLSGANNKDGEIVWKGDIGINEEHDIKISVKPVKTDIELPVKVTYVKDSVTANKIMTAATAKGVDIQFIPIDPIDLEIILLLIKIAKELPGFGIILGIGGILTIYLFRRLKVI